VRQSLSLDRSPDWSDSQEHISLSCQTQPASRSPRLTAPWRCPGDHLLLTSLSCGALAAPFRRSPRQRCAEPSASPPWLLVRCSHKGPCVLEGPAAELCHHLVPCSVLNHQIGHHARHAHWNVRQGRGLPPRRLSSFMPPPTRPGGGEIPHGTECRGGDCSRHRYPIPIRLERAQSLADAHGTHVAKDHGRMRMAHMVKNHGRKPWRKRRAHTPNPMTISSWWATSPS